MKTPYLIGVWKLFIFFPFALLLFIFSESSWQSCCIPSNENTLFHCPPSFLPIHFGNNYSTFWKVPCLVLGQCWHLFGEIKLFSICLHFNVYFVKTFAMKTIFLRQAFVPTSLRSCTLISPNSKWETGLSDKGFHSKSVFCLCNKIEVLGLHAIQQSC